MTEHITANTPLVCSDERHAAKVADLERQLAALRQVARGYCPECGRGDAAPTVEDWEQQKQRADQAEAKVADYENRITWHTTCEACARVLDSAIAETERRERAEAAIARVREAAAWIRRNYPGLHHIHDRLTTALDQPAPSAATQATGFVPFTPPHILKVGGDPADALVVEPYSNDQGQNVWVFRCWGTDTCDGWLSLDHYSQQSAERARDRHVAEEHQ